MRGLRKARKSWAGWAAASGTTESASISRPNSSGSDQSGSWEGFRRAESQRAMAITTPARIEVAPSTKNSQRNEISARTPPIAGPTLIPRFTARRLSAKAALRCGGRTRSEIIERLGGRTDSFRMAKRNVMARIVGKLCARGKRNSRTPDRNSDVLITAMGPTMSVRRPAIGIVMRAAIP